MTRVMRYVFFFVFEYILTFSKVFVSFFSSNVFFSSFCVERKESPGAECG